MKYAGVSLEEYQKACEKLRTAGEGNMHLEYLELMADQLRERFQRAFDKEDDGQKPEVVSELQGLIGKILRSLERQDLR
jgi:DNA-binding transcriptional MerR regulator